MADQFAKDRALFAISVASELTGVSPQGLRGYEDKGLIQPHRTAGGTRRYSRSDLDRVDQITTLLAAGVNLTGVAHILELQDETERLRAQLSRGKSGDGAPR